MVPIHQRYDCSGMGKGGWRSDRGDLVVEVPFVPSLDSRDVLTVGYDLAGKVLVLLFCAFESFVNLVESFVDQIESFVNLVESFVDQIEFSGLRAP